MRRALVTGGLGFIGSNLTQRLLSNEWVVVVLDDFSRRGAETNAEWLQENDPQERLDIVEGDIRDSPLVIRLVQGADVVFHLAGQVSAAASVREPRADFEINALGTLNVLEGARVCNPHPAVIFVSTNKVYGALDKVPIAELPKRYAYADGRLGISEDQPLDFHTPYACSKGAADQYVRDYSRIYGLPTIVFRMSSIYGPRQYGSDDQGWLAFLCAEAAAGRPVGIYGVGKQVRDILYVDDLLNAFEIAIERIGDVKGEVFNIGGGPLNTLSILELFGILKTRNGWEVVWSTVGSRPGDQMIYVSDITKVCHSLSWKPLVSPQDGVAKLVDWIQTTSLG